jgi:hypothetical protein
MVLTEVAVGIDATYYYSSFTGAVPAVGDTFVVTGFVAPGNNVTGTITSASGGASGTVVMAITTQANEVHAGAAQSEVLPDFLCPVGRPVEIISATLILTSSTPNVEFPLELLDDDQWAGVQIKSLTSTLPGKLYYSPDFPNGSIYLHPIPTVANSLRLQTRSLVSRFADLATPYDFPFGYEDALVMSLAEKSLAAYPRPEVTPLIMQQARDARAVIGSANTKSPKLNTSFGRESSWHFLTGGYK